MEPAFQRGKQILPETIEKQIENTLHRLKNEL
jgi:hypothetical protein